MTKIVTAPSFEEALAQNKANASLSGGIGTLQEKTIHSVLKNYYAPHLAMHEQKVAGYVADIFTGQHIIEIQTRQFQRLNKKLEAFLPLYDVTVVYPVAHTKWLSWIDPETGEVTKKRKSPKTGHIYQICRELYRIKPYLTHPHLHFIICLLEVEEYKMLNGWSHDKKRGATRHDGFPTRLVEEVTLNHLADFVKLLPSDLPTPFTSKDYHKLTKLPINHASTALNVLYSMGLIERVGKVGNAYCYERHPDFL